MFLLPHKNVFSCRNSFGKTCWDADRLDLPRVGIIPKKDRLCTEAAKGLLPVEQR